MNGREFKYSELNDIVKPQEVKTTSVKTNKDGSTSIYITTKAN